MIAFAESRGISGSCGKAMLEMGGEKVKLEVGEWKVEPIQLQPEDEKWLEFLEYMNLVEKELYKALGIPSHILGKYRG